MSDTEYSVLMSVYRKEKAAYLKTSMESIFSQTIPTNDFVLICDGPLNSVLDEIIEEMEEKFGEILHVVRLEKNSGLGNALNIGIKYCKNELVARMDSDDISYPDRCERQLKVFEDKPEISICSGIVEEFSVSQGQVDARRIPPETQEQILNFAKKRNPFNHPCVMYRKSAVEAAGGYQDFYLLEDYFLWVRMLMMGCVGYNLQEPLLYMRAGSDMYKRRAGWRYAIAQKELFKYMKKTRFINNSQYITSSLTRGIASVIPNGAREFAFKLFVRNRGEVL